MYFEILLIRNVGLLKMEGQLLSFERNLMRMYQALHRKPELHVFATKELAVLAEKMERMSEGEILAEDEGLRDLAPEVRFPGCTFGETMMEYVSGGIF